MEDRLLQKLESPDPVIRFEGIHAIMASPERPPASILKALEGIAAGDPSMDVRMLARRCQDGILDPTEDDSDEALALRELKTALSSEDSRERLEALEEILARRPQGMGMVAHHLTFEGDIKVLGRALMILAESGRSEFADSVLPFLEHEDNRVCANAIEAFSVLGGQERIRELFPMLGREDNRIQANLMVGLYPSYPRQVMWYLDDVMLCSERVSNRASALFCLRHVRSEDAIGSVLRLLQNETEEPLVRSALQVLRGVALLRRHLEALARVQQERAPPSPLITAFLEEYGLDPEEPTPDEPTPDEPIPDAAAPDAPAPDAPAPDSAAPTPAPPPMTGAWMREPKLRPRRASTRKQAQGITLVGGVVLGVGLYLSMSGELDRRGPPEEAPSPLWSAPPERKIDVRYVLLKGISRDGRLLTVESEGRTHSLVVEERSVDPEVGETYRLERVRLVPQRSGSPMLIARKLSPEAGFPSHE